MQCFLMQLKELASISKQQTYDYAQQWQHNKTNSICNCYTCGTLSRFCLIWSFTYPMAAFHPWCFQYAIWSCCFHSVIKVLTVGCIQCFSFYPQVLVHGMASSKRHQDLISQHPILAGEYLQGSGFELYSGSWLCCPLETLNYQLVCNSLFLKHF